MKVSEAKKMLSQLTYVAVWLPVGDGSMGGYVSCTKKYALGVLRMVPDSMEVEAHCDDGVMYFSGPTAVL